MDADPRTTIAGQARSIAAAWSPPDAPPSWWLTAATFTAIAEDDALLDLAATIPFDRLPPLLLSAAIRYHLDDRGPPELRRYYPSPGGSQRPPDGGFRPALRGFASSEAKALTDLCRQHRYQMTEVARCLDLLPALATIAAEDPRTIALVDLGTGAGLGLHPDRYHCTYRLPDGTALTAGDEHSPVHLSCDVRGALPPPRVPAIAARLGVDVEPLDLADERTARWLAACVPPEVDAVTRFSAAVDVARQHPAPTLRGDLVDVLPAVVERTPPGALLVLVDTYVHVFLPPGRLAAFRAGVDRLGRRTDLEWVSVDPLVPLGPAPTGTVQGLDVPPGWLEEDRVFGVIGRVGYRGGERHEQLLGRAHPGAAWLEWTPDGRQR
ncbi:DUF2332 domain-containing protein [Geodermatophilus marinus]|uniref:DUF2332 domain-containing protein n=1 Tax=Geodermatophilus sp. LHW52908 TaxID=2303986 RepID=UPI001314906F|nr:DUF2332 domain-containing protein [Geodermatophilus sp. LHW52908]